MIEMQPYIVYIKPDDQNRIKAVNSSAFLRDTDGWVEIDRGFDTRHHHAQGNYFPLPIYDERGIHRYMIAKTSDWPERKMYVLFTHNNEEWAVYERTQAEMDADYVPYTPPVDPKEAEIMELKNQVAALSAAMLNL